VVPDLIIRPTPVAGQLPHATGQLQMMRVGGAHVREPVEAPFDKLRAHIDTTCTQFARCTWHARHVQRGHPTQRGMFTGGGGVGGRVAQAEGTAQDCVL
jgi:hypothetical protein